MRTPIQQYIIDRVREKRQAIGISQEKLSIALGFESQGYISKIESNSENYNDHYNIDPSTKLQKYLNVLHGNFDPRNRCELFQCF